MMLTSDHSESLIPPRRSMLGYCLDYVRPGVTFMVTAVSVIGYYTTGVIVLFSDWKEDKHCAASHLRQYVLLGLLFNVSLCASRRHGGYQEEEGDASKDSTISLFRLGANAGLSIWGGVEIWHQSCVWLTPLWIMGNINFGVQVLAILYSLVTFAISRRGAARRISIEWNDARYTECNTQIV